MRGVSLNIEWITERIKAIFLPDLHLALVLVHPPRFNYDHLSRVQVFNSRALTWQSTFFYWANLVRAWSSLISQLLLFQSGGLLWPWYPCSNDTGTQCRYSVPWYKIQCSLVHLLKTSLFQASCGRMGREKIEDLVCAPHLSYTQQVGHPDTSLQHTSRKCFHKGRILYLHLSVHITHNLQNTADMARFISFRPSVVLPLFTSLLLLFRLGIFSCFTWSARTLKR